MPGDPDPARRHACKAEDRRPVVTRVDGQERDEGDADAGGDELLDGAVVVGAEDDVRLEAGVAEAVLDLVDAAALAVADQRHCRDLAEGRRLGPAGQRRVDREDDDVRVAHQLDGLERPLADREHHEGEVELAALDELEQAAVVGRLGQLDGHVRPGVRELAQQAWEHARAHALVGADVQRPRRALGERGHVGLGRLQAGDDACCVAEEELAGLGEGDPARPAGPLDELLPDDALERLDLLAHGRLGVAELLGGAPERALLGHRLKGREMP